MFPAVIFLCIFLRLSACEFISTPRFLKFQTLSNDMSFTFEVTTFICSSSCNLPHSHFSSSHQPRLYKFFFLFAHILLKSGQLFAKSSWKEFSLCVIVLVILSPCFLVAFSYVLSPSFYFFLKCFSFDHTFPRLRLIRYVLHWVSMVRIHFCHFNNSESWP